MTAGRADESSAETDERIALAIARWQGAHRAALDDGDTKSAEIIAAVLDTFLRAARDRAAAVPRQEPAAG
ncbi:hypothetical protein [Nocardia sp. NPDC057353]|uniref:hypothetical protein n=1 Tax=Nocardia sp. NPDC057353 TaxID=3346104 RepID=UPI003631F298